MGLGKPDREAIAVITGASSGIGECLARLLAARGHNLLLVARRQQLLDALGQELSHAHGVTVESRGVDLADRAARAELCAELASRPVQVLCNNAGFVNWGLIRDLDPVSEQMVVELDTVAVHALTLAVLPGMLARGAGVIEMTGSLAGMQPMPGCATYAACKAFVNSFSESLHGELAGTGVSCTLLAPGPVRTGLLDASGISGVDGVGGNLVWLTAERVAQDTLKAMERGRRVIVPGAFAKVNALSGRFAPRALLLPLLKQVSAQVVQRGGGQGS